MRRTPRLFVRLGLGKLLLVCMLMAGGSVEAIPDDGNGADNLGDAQEIVSVYNWPDYIPDGVLEEFTQETGIKVKYSTYDNNEVMYTRLKLLRGRGYDVLVPSSSLVSRMRDEGLIQPIDHGLLPNFSNLSLNLLNRSYDPDNNYSIPYLWGSAGIGINTKRVDASSITKWSDLWSRRWKGRLLLTDDMREVFHMALAMGGHSSNTTDPEEIKQAYDRLSLLMPNVKIISADPRPEFMDGNVDIGQIWNGEMAVAQKENPAIQYIYPKEGASFWVDSFVIPARAANVENAHRFIDFMLRPDIAARCVEELGYASPNQKARELLPQDVRDNPIIFPSDQIMSKAEFQDDIGKARELYLLYWNKLKGGGGN